MLKVVPYRKVLLTAGVLAMSLPTMVLGGHAKQTNACTVSYSQEQTPSGYHFVPRDPATGEPVADVRPPTELISDQRERERQSAVPLECYTSVLARYKLLIGGFAGLGIAIIALGLFGRRRTKRRPPRAVDRPPLGVPTGAVGPPTPQPGAHPSQSEPATRVVDTPLGPVTLAAVPLAAAPGGDLAPAAAAIVAAPLLQLLSLADASGSLGSWLDVPAGAAPLQARVSVTPPLPVQVHVAVGGEWVDSSPTGSGELVHALTELPPGQVWVQAMTASQDGPSPTIELVVEPVPPGQSAAPDIAAAA